MWDDEIRHGKKTTRRMNLGRWKNRNSTLGSRWGKNKSLNRPLREWEILPLKKKKKYREREKKDFFLLFCYYSFSPFISFLFLSLFQSIYLFLLSFLQSTSFNSFSTKRKKKLIIPRTTSRAGSEVKASCASNDDAVTCAFNRKEKPHDFNNSTAT